MKKDGSSIQKLNNRRTYEPKVVEGYIYYEDWDDNFSLYRCNLDGTGEIEFPKGVAFYTVISNERVYYLDTRDDYKCYTTTLDGRDKTLFIEKSCRELCLQDNVLYYSLDAGGIVAYDLNNKTSHKISKAKVRSMNVSGEWIYFANEEKDYKLYKMKLDGTEVTKITDSPVELINVVGNLIAFRDRETEAFSWCLSDASNLRPIQ